jgi:predicted hotdog family 3-hydroxylacyl-ACP dehydratase
MKATIRADGALAVIPESELEAYALSKWCANHQQGDNSSSLEVLFGKLCIEPPNDHP